MSQLIGSQGQSYSARGGVWKICFKLQNWSSRFCRLDDIDLLTKPVDLISSQGDGE